MGIPERNCQGVDPGEFHQPFRILGISHCGFQSAFRRNVVNLAYRTDLALYRNAQWAGHGHNFLQSVRVFIEWSLGVIQHHRCVSRVNALLYHLNRIAMVEVYRCMYVELFSDPPDGSGDCGGRNERKLARPIHQDDR